MLNMLYAIVYLAGLSHPCFVICHRFDQQDPCLLGQKHICGCPDLCVAATMPVGTHVLLLFCSAIFVYQPQLCNKVLELSYLSGHRAAKPTLSTSTNFQGCTAPELLKESA